MHSAVAYKRLIAQGGGGGEKGIIIPHPMRMSKDIKIETSRQIGTRQHIVTCTHIETGNKVTKTYPVQKFALMMCMKELETMLKENNND